jgi:hypothetical protein
LRVVEAKKIQISWKWKSFFKAKKSSLCAWVIVLNYKETKIKMSTKSPGPQRCRLILQQCLAIQLSKSGNAPEDFWMYDSGYMIFQVSLSFSHMNLVRNQLIYTNWTTIKLRLIHINFNLCHAVCRHKTKQIRVEHATTKHRKVLSIQFFISFIFLLCLNS